MFRPLELFVGLRYTRAKRRNHFISFISLISMLGIAVGVTALITVLSVMNGFEQELRERILGMVAHATIAGTGEGMSDWQSVTDRAVKHPEVLGAAPYIRQESMLQGKRVSGALIRGILPEREGSVSEVGDDMVAGSLDRLESGGYGIVLGRELAFALGVSMGDRVTVYVPEINVTPIGGMPRAKRFTVVGMFQAGMQEYDRGLALVHMEDASRLLRMGERVTGVRLRLDDMFQAWRVGQELASELPERYYVSDWTSEHANFFRAVRTEKLVMFVILSLIVAVAAFNIVSTLVMVVTDKESDIAILRTLGTSPMSVMGIFIVQGTVIGLIGTGLGLAGGVALASNVETIVPALERFFGVQFLPSDIYYISDLPSDLRWNQVTFIGVVAFAMSSLATLYPAWRASRTEPASALRYE
jgi:lipoprotein-releasing system permease protein